MNMPPEKSAEDLNRYLNAEIPQEAPGVPGEEASLANELSRLAQGIQPAPQFQQELESRLITSYPLRQPAPQRHRFSDTLRTLVWVSMIAFLVLALSWAIRNLLPRPATPAILPTAPAVTATAAPSRTPAGEALPPPEMTAVAPELSYTSPMMPGFTLDMKAAFPETPGEVALYEQLPQEQLTLEQARAIGNQLGIDGHVYQGYEEMPGVASYIVTDGVRRVLIFSPQRFYYLANYPLSMIRRQGIPPVEAQVQTAEDFLKSHGLLDFPYRVITGDDQPGLVRFAPLLDDLPVTYNAYNSPQIEVEIDFTGQVRSMTYTRLSWREVERYPVISAQEAWDKVVSEQLSSQVEFSQITRSPANEQTWQREYPLGQRVELFGYFEVLQPAEPGISPFYSFNNFPVQGDLQALGQSVSSGRFMQVWGQMAQDADGTLVFHIEGWQESPFTDQSLQGAIQRQGDKVYLQSDDQHLYIPDAPDGLADGDDAEVRGIILQDPEPTLEWAWINSGYNMGGGGGGGGAGFAELNLDGSLVTPLPPIPTPYPTPAPGARLEAIEGQLSIMIHQYEDGTSWKEITLYAQPQADRPEELSLRLEGPALEGIDRYYHLPIRVWGRIAETPARLPVLEVERYEPVYPDLAIQAWLGTWENTTLEGQQVILFTTQQGQRYVLASSIDLEADSGVGVPGEAIIVEGYVQPERTFGGYPVIVEFGVSMSQGANDLSNYQMLSATPPVFQESSPKAESGTVTVDQIELVYYTQDMRFNVSGNTASTIYIQPVWRFAGQMEDGTHFEFLVQALSSEYLK